MSFEEILGIINQYLPTITSIAGIIFVIWKTLRTIGQGLADIFKKTDGAVADQNKKLEEVTAQLQNVEQKYNELLTEITKIYHQ